MESFSKDLNNELNKAIEKSKENYRVVKALIYRIDELEHNLSIINNIFMQFSQVLSDDKCIYIENNKIKDNLNESAEYPLSLINKICEILIFLFICVANKQKASTNKCYI